ncbi:MAG: apolipoprotein N-acyltransferase [Actinomycetota bacterium]
MPRLRIDPTSFLRGRRAYITVAASGGALTLAFPEPDLAPLAWLALVPLLAILGAPEPSALAARVRRGFGLGFVFGIAFFGTLLHWITIVGYAAWVVLVVGQALFVGVFGAAVAVATARGGGAVRVLAPPLAWVGIEYLRASFPLGGFTWGALAQSQHDLSWLLRAAGIGGGWAVALLVVAANALLLETWWALRARRARGAVALFLGAVAVLSAPALLPSHSATGDAIEVAIVQGNVPEPFVGTALEKELAILQSHRDLTRALAPESPDLVVWPESAAGIDPTTNEVAATVLADAAQAVGAPMIVGGNIDLPEERYQVMTFQVAPSGNIVDSYQKTHLVPFGEFVPARAALDFIPMLDQIPRDAVAGREHRIFDVAGGKVATVISFEGDFGSLVRRPISGGGRLLVVATNTSTWRRSWASAQHVAFSQVRAAENGVWVVHAAISGISAFISPAGKVVASTPLWTALPLVEDVRFAQRVTFYTRTGDWLPLAASAGALILVAAGVWRARREESA